MKPKLKAPKQASRIEKRGGYRGYRTRSDESGATPRQLVDLRRAEKLQLEIAETRGELLRKADVESERRDTAEILKSDLGSLSTRLSTQIAGRKLTVVQAREIVVTEIRAMVANWHAAGKVNAEAVPS